MVAASKYTQSKTSASVGVFSAVKSNAKRLRSRPCEAHAASALPLVNTQNNAPSLDKGSVFTKLFADGRTEAIDKETGEVVEFGGVKTSEKIREQRYALKSVISKSMPAHRVAKCMNWKLPASQVKVFKHQETNKAFYGGLEVCSNVWVCPCCSAKISEKRRNELSKAKDNAAKLGYQMVMLTLTAPHYEANNLGELLKGLRESLTKSFKDRSGKNFLNRFRVLGRIRALEVTWSQDNGFHPHFHILLFVPSSFTKKDFKDMESSFYPLWKHACTSRGLGVPSRKHGVSVDAGQAVSDYVGKWGLEDEMTKSHAKRSKKGYSMFDLMRAYQETSDELFFKIWMIYVHSFKRQRQLVWSKGLKDLLQIDEKTDEELALEQLEVATEFKVFTSKEWQAVVKTDSHAFMLNLAEKSPDRFDDVLKGLMRLFGD